MGWAMHQSMGLEKGIWKYRRTAKKDKSTTAKDEKRKKWKRCGGYCFIAYRNRSALRGSQ